MSWVRFSLAVAGTSLALVIALFATGAFLVGNVFANATQAVAAQAMGAPHDWNVPPELANLKDIPQDQRFSHFRGVTANLTDKDGKPIAVTVTPGKATSVSSSSITLAGNDGASHTYSLDANTFTAKSTPAAGQDVVVVTLNNSQSATAVIAPNANWDHTPSRGGPPFGR
jgi:hypothetical protein